MINWNPFRTKPKPDLTNGTGVQIIGPGSNNVKVIDLSQNRKNAGTQIILGQNPQIKQTYQT